MKNSITFKATSSSAATTLGTYYYDPIWGFSTEPFYFADQAEAQKHLPAAKVNLINRGMHHIIEDADCEFGIY